MEPCRTVDHESHDCNSIGKSCVSSGSCCLCGSDENYCCKAAMVCVIADDSRLVDQRYLSFGGVVYSMGENVPWFASSSVMGWEVIGQQQMRRRLQHNIYSSSITAWTRTPTLFFTPIKFVEEPKKGTLRHPHLLPVRILRKLVCLPDPAHSQTYTTKKEQI
jgi:hypothetical protein